ncbi:MAG: hypothetical protein PHW92_04075 [Lutibacter sp.]|nr:hypothetical protein [Lutibacter sp.]
MIRFDGYYIFEPVLFQERKEWTPDYSIRALMFQDNGIVTTAQKWTKKDKDTVFNIKDFDIRSNSEKFGMTDRGFFILSNEGKQWEERFYYDIISDERFISRQTGETIRFIPWNYNK